MWDGEFNQTSGPDDYYSVTALAETGMAPCNDPDKRVYCRDCKLDVAEGGDQPRASMNQPYLLPQTQP